MRRDDDGITFVERRPADEVPHLVHDHRLGRRAGDDVHPVLAQMSPVGNCVERKSTYVGRVLALSFLLKILVTEAH